jgi:hypothetical protein
MVILYIYLTCWRMKSVFYERQQWGRLDNIMLTWILGTVSVELHEIIHEPSEIARRGWRSVEAQFLSNRESHVLQINVKFHDFKHGDLRVSNYCCKMRGMVDDLHGLGETITNHHLDVNLLQGLNKKCNHMKTFTKHK